MGPEIDVSALKTEKAIADTIVNEYTRGYDTGLEQACLILETDEALSGVSHKAIKMAIRAMKRGSTQSEGPEQ